jgi:TonB family protein
MRRWPYIILLGCSLFGGLVPAWGQPGEPPLPPRPEPPRKIKPLKPCTFKEVPRQACAEYARVRPYAALDLSWRPSPLGYLRALEAKLRRGCVSTHAVEKAVLSKKTAILVCFHAGAPQTSVRVRTTWRRAGYGSAARPASVTFDPLPPRKKGCYQDRSPARDAPSGASATALKACLKKALSEARIRRYVRGVKPGVAYPAVVDFRLAHGISVRGSVMARPGKSRPRQSTSRRGAVDSVAPHRVTRPRVLKRVLPDYPTHLQKLGVHGRVVLQLTINRNGRVAKTKVLASLHKALDTSAIEAAKKIPSLDLAPFSHAGLL